MAAGKRHEKVAHEVDADIDRHRDAQHAGHPPGDGLEKGAGLAQLAHHAAAALRNSIIRLPRQTPNTAG
jgi:hypothetical protein